MILTDKEADELFNKYTDQKKECAIMVTDKCNMSCKICFRECNKNNKNVISYKTIRQIISKLDSSWYVAITGGEPTLYLNKVLYIIKLCKKKGIHTRLKTNGYWPAGAIWRIRKAAPTILCIGVNGFHKKIYSRLNKIIEVFSDEKVKTKVMINCSITGQTDVDRLNLKEGTHISYIPIFPSRLSSFSTLGPQSEFRCVAQGMLISPKGLIFGFCCRFRGACRFGNIKTANINKIHEILLKRKDLVFKLDHEIYGLHCEPVNIDCKDD